MIKAIVTVIGKDKVGIIAAVSGLLARRQVNILDISQTTMQDYFTMIMLVDIKGLNVPYDELERQFEALGRETGVSIRIQREELFNAMHHV